MKAPPAVASPWQPCVMGAAAFESVSTWKSPTPPPASGDRSRVLTEVADRVLTLSPGRLRVIVDGRTGSGKTMLADELAAVVRHGGRPTLRASLDDFKRTWADARRHGYNRESGEGYYRNTPDVVSTRDLLLAPAGPTGSGVVVLCAHDPLTGEDHRATTVTAPSDAVLIVDSVFGMRPEYEEFWDHRIWVEVDRDVALARGIERDVPLEGRAEAERLHRARFQVGEEIYLAEVDPRSKADTLIENTTIDRPVILR